MDPWIDAEMHGWLDEYMNKWMKGGREGERERGMGGRKEGRERGRDAWAVHTYIDA